MIGCFVCCILIVLFFLFLLWNHSWPVNVVKLVSVWMKLLYFGWVSSQWSTCLGRQRQSVLKFNFFSQLGKLKTKKGGKCTEYANCSYLIELFRKKKSWTIKYWHSTLGKSCPLIWGVSDIWENEHVNNIVFFLALFTKYSRPLLMILSISILAINGHTFYGVWHRLNWHFKPIDHSFLNVLTFF